MSKIKQWKIELKAAEEKLQKINNLITEAKKSVDVANKQPFDYLKIASC